MTNLQAAEHLIALMSHYERGNACKLDERRTAVAMAIGALFTTKAYSPYAEVFSKVYARDNE